MIYGNRKLPFLVLGADDYKSTHSFFLFPPPNDKRIQLLQSPTAVNGLGAFKQGREREWAFSHGWILPFTPHVTQRKGIFLTTS
ncbi:hypothetical protein CEXT_87971 [Caerostris extrusa]|uniref:Uncharacterized protein n=1 Tax=Caerostris extrusa TaxID=172846 RepID=A0AAV4MMS7_CAEEX|nr:hypothetical protein CEXT_87971 [Caerostris extrusa]